MQILFTVLTLWLGANLLHAAWVGARRSLWERRHARDGQGLLPLAAAHACGRGATALLFIHGFADTPRIWLRVAERLAGAGPFTCRAMRLPGSGEPARAAKRQTLEVWRRAVDEELDRLRAAHERVWLVGHSMGGALAFDAALRRPAAVDGVAAFAPLLRVSGRRAPLLPPAAWFRLATATLALSPTFESCFSPDAVAIDDPAFTYPKDRFIPFCVYRALFALIRSNRGRAAELGCPVCAFLSARDAVVDTPAALRWLDGCRGAKRVRVLDGVGHVLPLEACWRELADELADFVRTAPPARR